MPFCPGCGKDDMVEEVGPEGTTCGTCRYLYRKKWGGTYFKCELYGDSNGPGTDFRKKWQSCRKYEAREDVNGY